MRRQSLQGGARVAGPSKTVSCPRKAPIIVEQGGHMRVESLIAFLLVVAFCLTGCIRKRENPMVSAAAGGSGTQLGTMPRDEVHDIASRAAIAEGYDLEKSAAPKITFDPETQQWSVRFEGTGPAPGNNLLVIVDDGTGKASVRPETRVGTMPREKVHDTARRAARAEGVDLEKFAAPKITFDPETQQWWLFFEGIVEPCPGNYFHVIVDDRTGKASVRGGE